MNSRILLAYVLGMNVIVSHIAAEPCCAHEEHVACATKHCQHCSCEDCDGEVCKGCSCHKYSDNE